MHAPAAILFDLDDTLIAFEAVSDSAWREVTSTHAPRIGVPAERIREAIQSHSRWFWSDPQRHRDGRRDLPLARRRLVLTALGHVGHHDESTAQALADHYTRLRTELIHLLPGALELLTALHDRGTRLGMVTNGSEVEQRAKIERFALARFFEFIQVEGELGVGKPEDAAYEHALARIGLPPEDVWFVGDNLEWDVRAPQRHGMTGVWVDRLDQGMPAEPMPDHRVRDVVEVAGMLGLDT